MDRRRRKRSKESINNPLTSWQRQDIFLDKLKFFAISAAILAFFLGTTFLVASKARAEEVWKVTSYCSCKKCCGSQAKGLTASGKHVKSGMVAINWLPFGTKIKIEGWGVYTVEDRGARSLFGSKANHIKHVDIYIPSHSDALKFGVKYLSVEVL